MNPHWYPKPNAKTNPHSDHQGSPPTAFSHRPISQGVASTAAESNTLIANNEPPIMVSGRASKYVSRYGVNQEIS